MQTVKKFIRETLHTLNEDAPPGTDRVDATAGEVADVLDGMADRNNPFTEALNQLLKDNRDEIMADVTASFNRLGAGEGMVGNDIDIAVAARNEIINLLKKDKAMPGVRYPWRTALWITAYEAGTWSGVDYIKHVAYDSVALLGPLAGPINDVEEALIDEATGFLEDQSGWTIGGAAAGAVVLGAAAVNWKLHTKLLDWLFTVGKNLPGREMWDTFSAKTMANTISDDVAWSSLFDELVTESGDNIERVPGTYLAFKGAWRGYTPATYKTALDGCRRALTVLLSKPDDVYNIPIYMMADTAGQATRVLLGHIQVKKQVLTLVSSNETSLDYIKNATQKILKRVFIGQTHTPEAVSAGIDKLLTSQLASETIDGASDAVDATAPVLGDPIARMMDVAGDAAAFNQLMSDRIKFAILKAQEAGSGFTFVPSPDARALNINDLPANFYPDASFDSRIQALRTSVISAKSTLVDFVKTASIPLENITALGKFVMSWRMLRTGGRLSAKIFGRLIQAGTLYAIINPAWKDNPKGLEVIESAQYMMDAKIRLDAHRSWDLVRATEEITMSQDKLAKELGGLNPSEAAQKWIEADVLLGKILKTQCGGPNEVDMMELINEVIVLYEAYEIFRNGPADAGSAGVRESRVLAHNKTDSKVLRTFLREMLGYTRR